VLGSVSRVPASQADLEALARGQRTSARELASSFSNTGSPSPAGTPCATQVTTPPSESPARRASSMRRIISSAATGSGQRVIEASTCSRVTASASHFASTACTCETKATISPQPNPRSTLRAIAPAATRPIVSRALARPPPCQLRTPYLAS
jgi:hypothetical protein